MHLSVYALVESQDDIQNPNTGDSIIKYFILIVASLFGLGLYANKTIRRKKMR